MATLKPYYEEAGIQIYHGDCRDVLPALASESVDAILTDPPYELGFMAKHWDRSGIAYNVEAWRECLRVLKPGGHLLAFGGSRTYHRLASAIEDAGFEIRDQIQWIYGSGFPKSLDVSKAIDSAAGAEREIVGANPYNARRPNPPISELHQQAGWPSNITIPATDAAEQWEGWGTALKPAHEILTLAYKPYEYEGERDKIDANLLLLEARLWSLLPASVAETTFKLSPQEYVGVCGSAQWSAEQQRSTRADLLETMDMPQFVLAMTMCLNIVRSWQSILGELCDVVSTSTIETRSSVITDLRILSCLLSQTTLSTIIRAASQADGRALNALPVAQHFNAARLKLNGILTLFAQDAAMCAALTLHRGEVETDGIVLARKPLIGTVAENVLKHGTGGLNVDGCRIETDGRPLIEGDYKPTQNNTYAGRMNGSLAGGSKNSGETLLGRWPANVIHDGSGEVLAGFPETQTGELKPYTENHQNASSFQFQRQKIFIQDGSFGSAARFFYCAKASKEDREEGLEDLAIRSAGDVTDRKDGSDGLKSPRAGAGRTNGSRNHHPTVKPTDLMRYLVRLITPLGGVCLDPFAGSGSTGKACALEGMQSILIEKELEYCELAARRTRLRQPRLLFEATA